MNTNEEKLKEFAAARNFRLREPIEGECYTLEKKRNTTIVNLEKKLKTTIIVYIDVHPRWHWWCHPVVQVGKGAIFDTRVNLWAIENILVALRKEAKELTALLHDG